MENHTIEVEKFLPSLSLRGNREARLNKIIMLLLVVLSALTTLGLLQLLLVIVADLREERKKTGSYFLEREEP